MSMSGLKGKISCIRGSSHIPLLSLPEVGAHGGQDQPVTRDPPGVTVVSVTIAAEYNVSVLRRLPHRVEHAEGFSEHLITLVNCLHHAIIIPRVSQGSQVLFWCPLLVCFRVAKRKLRLPESAAPGKCLFRERKLEGK